MEYFRKISQMCIPYSEIVARIESKLTKIYVCASKEWDRTSILEVSYMPIFAIRLSVIQFARGAKVVPPPRNESLGANLSICESQLERPLPNEPRWDEPRQTRCRPTLPWKRPICISGVYSLNYQLHPQRCWTSINLAVSTVKVGYTDKRQPNIVAYRLLWRFWHKITLQGDTSPCFQPPVDMKTKVVF